VLTIHSSRSRFAARLNSGVRPRMKIFTSLLIFLTLSGCATSANVGYLSLCGAGDSRQWKPVDAPPDAAALRILADTSPNAPAGKLSYPVEQWFQTPDQQFMLCRTDHNSCLGEWWVFQNRSLVPSISKQDAWLCVSRAGPNNSFKPKPLRGSA
jgi:hypothetical protein